MSSEENDMLSGHKSEHLKHVCIYNDLQVFASYINTTIYLTNQ